jgi:hypothetical protein
VQDRTELSVPGDIDICRYAISPIMTASSIAATAI